MKFDKKTPISQVNLHLTTLDDNDGALFGFRAIRDLNNKGKSKDLPLGVFA